MFLGPSETLGDLADEFETIQRHWKVYLKRRDVSLSHEIRFPFGVSGLADRVVGSDRVKTRRSSVDKELLNLYDAALRDFMPPGVLIDRHGKLLHAFRGVGRFLSVPDGRPSAGVWDQFPVEVRSTAVGLLQRPSDGPPVSFRHLPLDAPDGSAAMDVTVRVMRFPESDEPCVLVSFTEAEVVKDVDSTANEPDENHHDSTTDHRLRDHVDSLESELRVTREKLQATVGKLETSNEELQATNEELVASNQEMQSTNEELHSVNEELYTVNTEHQTHIDGLTELTADINGLTENTQIHTIFLGYDLTIKKFTPQIE